MPFPTQAYLIDLPVPRVARRREVESRFGAEDESRSSPSRAEVSPAALEQKAVQVRELLGQYRGAKRLVENVEAEDMVLKVSDNV